MLTDLVKIIRSRKNTSIDQSYTSKLLNEGTDSKANHVGKRDVLK